MIKELKTKINNTIQNTNILYSQSDITLDALKNDNQSTLTLILELLDIVEAQDTELKKLNGIVNQQKQAPTPQ